MIETFDWETPEEDELEVSDENEINEDNWEDKLDEYLTDGGVPIRWETFDWEAPEEDELEVRLEEYLSDGGAPIKWRSGA